jgi:formylglycine-generating enzyme required for sulfatase activity
VFGWRRIEMKSVVMAAAVIAAVVAASGEPAPGTLSAGPLEGMAFAWIPAGTFLMGDSGIVQMETNRATTPEHEVNVAGFEMMTTEVTQAMWLAVMGENPSWHQGDPGLPVEDVTWLECRAFSDLLDVLDPAHDYRLPTEAEWEYACRAGTETPFYWGETMDRDFCWWYVPGDTTTVTGSLIPNAWGLYDMSGNVSEWCEDTYHYGYEGAPSDGSAWIDPEEDARVFRGGSFFPCDIDAY